MSQMSGSIDDVRYAVFDDMPFASFPRPKQWFGAQKTITVTDKYKGKRTINWGKPCIFLANPEDDTSLIRDLSWYQENVLLVRIDSKLY